MRAKDVDDWRLGSWGIRDGTAQSWHTLGCHLRFDPLHHHPLLQVQTALIHDGEPASLMSTPHKREVSMQMQES